MLSEYQDTKNKEESVLGDVATTEDTGVGGGPVPRLKLSTLCSPGALKFKQMRHTISAASALQQHLTTAMKPRKYKEEHTLSAAEARDRKRLATRLNMLGFPLDPCLQALKQGKNKPSAAASLLLKWYPKGQGGRNLVQRMVDVIETSEKKLTLAHDRIKSIMSDGTPAERLTTVSRFFLECDINEKGYLTPLEFSNLSSNLGVELSTAELREAVMLIDDDGNGRVELVEYIEWWGDEEVLHQLINEQGGVSSTGGGAGEKKATPNRKTMQDMKTKTKKIKSRTNEASLAAVTTRVSPTQDPLGRLSPSGERNAKFAQKKSLGKQLTASDYLEQSMAMLQRQKTRAKASSNIKDQIGMYSHIREGGWFDKNGNMQVDKKVERGSPKTQGRRQQKATQFAEKLTMISAQLK